MCREVAVAYISKKYMSYRKTDPHDAELLQPVVAAVIRPTRENATNFCIRVIMYTCLKRLRQVLFAKRVPVKQEVKPPVAVWLEQTVR